MSKPQQPHDVQEFLQQVRVEARETSVRTFNRVVFLAGFVFLSPTIFLGLVDGAYDPWIRASHLLLAAAGFAFAWATRPGTKLSIEAQALLAPIYIVGVNLSPVLVLYRLREPLDVLPALLTIVVIGLIDRPLGWFIGTAALQAGAILLVASSEGWTDEWITVGLITMAIVAVFYAVCLKRQVHGRRIDQLRAEQLASQAALEREMEERTRLQEREITNEKMQSLGRLAGGIAHDLNNLLVPIIGNAELLMASELTREQREGLERVVDAAERASLLTRRLTAFAGKGGAVDEVFDLGKEITETSRLVLRTVPTPCSIEWDPPPSPVWITGDRAQVQQALLNLLLNAAEAIEGIPNATVRTHLEASVAGPDATAGPYARFVVTDEGPGIPDEDVRRVFDPFFTTKGSGRGLGLSAALGATQRQGGHLVAGNSEDRGAEFALYLKRADGPPVADFERPPTDRGNGRVLIVDDEEPVREIAKKTLEVAGFEVVTCAGGTEALAVAATPDLFDLAIVDLRMPGLSGRDTIDGLRTLRPELPVLICTGYGAEAAGWSESLEAVSVLAKPYRRNELIGSVSRLVNGGLG